MYKNRGCFFAFEGIDGAGKTTQLALLEHWFQQKNIACKKTREPGGTPFGSDIRALLFANEYMLTPLAELFLFEADRAQHVETTILPALYNNIHVLSDRFIDSSIVYQGIGRKLGIDLVESLSTIASDGLFADMTFLLDIDPKNRYRTQENHLDMLSFHESIREGYLALAHKYPKRHTILDATYPKNILHRKIVAIVEKMLKEEKP